MHIQVSPYLDEKQNSSIALEVINQRLKTFKLWYQKGQ